MPTPGLVTAHVWRVGRSKVPAALLRMATDRRRLTRTTGVRFARLLGTSSGTTFAIRDADLLHWALITAWREQADAAAFENGPVRMGWRRLAVEEWRLELTPLASRGQWSRREPFGRPVPSRWEGPVAAITRARLRPLRAATFWRAVPPVALDLHKSEGLLATLGIGEAPIGWQGTLSVWTDAGALRAFAYEGAAHVAAIRETEETGWYAEELFARFGVAGTHGTLDGRDPLACRP
jgi:hypothetical protein